MDGGGIRAFLRHTKEQHRSHRAAGRLREFRVGPNCKRVRGCASVSLSRPREAPGTGSRSLPGRISAIRCIFLSAGHHDNPRVDALVTQLPLLERQSCPSRKISRRALSEVLAASGTVGILADNNTLLAEGVFVDFFGIPACTTAGLARFALHSGAAVVRGFFTGTRPLRKYRPVLSLRLNWCAPGTTLRIFAKILSASRA